MHLSVPTVDTPMNASSDYPNYSAPPIVHMSSIAQLPSFTQIQEPDFMWGAIDGASLRSSVNSCFDEIVHWRQNLKKKN